MKTVFLLLTLCCAVTTALTNGTRKQHRFAVDNGRSLLGGAKQAAGPLILSTRPSMGLRKLQQSACGTSKNCISVSNSCPEPLNLILRYLPVDGEWVTSGMWQLMPGETTYIADTLNRYNYFHVRTESGLTFTENKFAFEFQGQLLPFIEVNLGDNRTSYTHNFIC